MKFCQKRKILLFFLTLSFFIFLFPKSQVLALKTSEKNHTEEKEIVIKLKTGSLYQMKFDQNTVLEEIIKSFSKNPQIKYVEPNFNYQITAFPNDPFYDNQIYLRKIQAKKAWSKELLEKQLKNITYQSVIAVIDTGVDINHPDLKDNIWQNSNEIANNGKDDDGNGYIDDIAGWDFVNEVADPKPKFSLLYTDEAIHHGTIVAGIAAAKGHNNEGIVGISWDAKVMSLRALDSLGRGNVYNVSRAVAYARENGADVINMSFVGLDYSQILFDEIKKAYEAGIIIVAAAGNTDPSIQGIDLDKTKSYPVCYDGADGENVVIGVASVDNNDIKSTFSNYGKQCVDISAPGENFFALQVYNSKYSNFNKYYKGSWSGTSVSVPLVSGAFAIMKSLNSNLTNEDIQTTLLNYSDKIDSLNIDYQGQMGSGRLNLYRAVNALLLLNPQEKKKETEKTTKTNYIVAGLGLGSVPQIKIYNMENEEYVRGFYAYSVYFSGSINIASGDVDGDGKNEIITGAGLGGGPHVRIFDQYGNLEGEFFAYNPFFRGGVYVAVADFDNDGKDEIITGAGPGGGPHVRVFDKQGKILSEFFAYAPGFRGGVYVASGDVDGDGKNEIITGAGPGGGPHVRIFNQYGNLKGQFFAFNDKFRGGVVVAAGDVNGTGRDEVITGVAKDGVPSIKIFNNKGYLLYNFFAYEANFYQGLNLSTADIDGDEVDEIITGKSIGGAPEIKIFDRKGQIKKKLFSHSYTYRGGVRPILIQY